MKQVKQLTSVLAMILFSLIFSTVAIAGGNDSTVYVVGNDNVIADNQTGFENTVTAKIGYNGPASANGFTGDFDQVGKSNLLAVSAYGNGDSMRILQAGNGNESRLYTRGNDSSVDSQIWGNGNDTRISQLDTRDSHVIHRVQGNANKLTAVQFGSDQLAIVQVAGNNNVMTMTQTPTANQG